jgi:MMPL family
MIGLGMATAILVDALVVRTVLVPAIMHTIGDTNWRLPELLNRRLPHLDIEGDAVTPPVEEEVRPEVPVAAWPTPGRSTFASSSADPRSSRRRSLRVDVTPGWLAVQELAVASQERVDAVILSALRNVAR